MEENRHVTLMLIGFNEQGRGNLSAVLTLASRALKHQWQIVDTETADFFLLSLESSMIENQAEILARLPKERCLFCTTENTPQTERSLLVDNNHLPRLSVLVSLFNQLTLNTNAEPVSEQKNVEAAIVEIENFFDYEKGLLGYLLTAVQGQFVIRVSNQPQCVPLYIDAEKKAYYGQINLAHLETYLANPDALTIQSISKSEIEQIISANSLKPRSVKELIWYITLKISAGQVVKGHKKSDIVMLKAWPDLRMYRCAEYAKAAAFMKNNAAPLEMIATETRMSLAEVNDFYNACYLMGLIEKKNELEIHKKEISAEKLDLLTRIDARLK